MRKVCGVGINDCKGWCNKAEHELERRIYCLWKHMLTRCYNQKSLEYAPTYKGCTVCERWFLLSTFAEDIKKLIGYDNWVQNYGAKICLDKDTLVLGNKHYSPTTCQFISLQDSSRDVVSRNRINSKESQLLAHLHKCKSVICTYPNGVEKVYGSIKEAAQVGSFNPTMISAVCLGRRKSHHGCSFRYA